MGSLTASELPYPKCGHFSSLATPPPAPPASRPLLPTDPCCLKVPFRAKKEIGALLTHRSTSLTTETSHVVELTVCRKKRGQRSDVENDINFNGNISPPPKLQNERKMMNKQPVDLKDKGIPTRTNTPSLPDATRPENPPPPHS
jgi:hypothetical protein